FEHEEIVQRLQQAKCLRDTDQRFQRALTVAFEFAQRPQGQSGHLRQFTLRKRLGKPLLAQTSTQRVQDLSGSREMKSHFYDPYCGKTCVSPILMYFTYS